MRYIVSLSLLLLMLTPFTAFADQKQDTEAILDEIGVYADKDPSVLAGAVFALGDAYVRENEVDKALALYEKALNVIPDNENLLNRAGNLYNQKAQYDKVAAIYEKLTKIKPENSWYFQMLSNAYRMSGKKDEAGSIWKKLLEKKPNDPNIAMQAANFYTNVDDLDNAILMAQKAVQLSPKNIGYLQNLAGLYERAKDFDKAERAFTEVGRMAKDQWLKDWANREIVNIYQKQNRLDELESNLEARIKDNPDDITLLKELGELYSRKNETEKALGVYGKAAKISVNDRDVNNRLVDLYESTQQFEKAAGRLQKIIDATPNDPYLLERLANLYSKADKKEEARKTWQDLVSKVTTDAALYSRYAEALYRWKDLDAAVAQLKKAQSMDPANLTYTLRMASIFIDAKKIEEAKVALGKVSLEAKEGWMKQEAKRRLAEVANMKPLATELAPPKAIAPSHVVREETKPVAEKVKPAVKKPAPKKEQPKKKKRGWWFGR